MQLLRITIHDLAFKSLLSNSLYYATKTLLNHPEKFYIDFLAAHEETFTVAPFMENLIIIYK